MIVCVDPRRTPVAEEAERTGGVHLAPKVGTNLALMNGLTRELLVNGWIDEQWVQQHTLGLEDLRSTVEPYTADKVAEICGVDAGDVRRAAQLFGESDNVLSTVLQGFYQSHQATAASVAVHNPAPAPRHDRAPRRRDSADERPIPRRRTTANVEPMATCPVP